MHFGQDVKLSAEPPCNRLLVVHRVKTVFVRPQSLLVVSGVTYGSRCADHNA